MFVGTLSKSHRIRNKQSYPSVMISSVPDSSLSGTVCPQHIRVACVHHTHLDLRNRLCYFCLSHTVHPSGLYAVYHTHLDLCNRLCYFTSSQTVHTSDLYAVYRTRDHLDNRLCSAWSAQIVYRGELYAVHRTHLHFSNCLRYILQSQTIYLGQLFATNRTCNFFWDRIWWARHRTQFTSLATEL